MANLQRGMMRMMRIPNHRVTVTAITDFTPWYRRITFHAPELIRDLEFFPTLWLRIWVEDPARGGDLAQRGYTFVDVRQEDGTFALDFVLHEASGPAGDWARRARVGEIREVALTPRKVVLPEGTTDLLLAGDITALPAINSWIEAVPEDIEVRVGIEDDHSDRESLPRSAGPVADWSWIPSEGPRGTALASWAAQAQAQAQVQAQAPRPGKGLYAWAAGEKTLIKNLRPVLRGQLELDRAHHFSQFYWIEGKGFG